MGTDLHETGVGTLVSSRAAKGGAAAVIALGIFSLVLWAPVDNTGSDPRASLLVSQAILEHGSIRLDPYMDSVPPGHVFHHRGGHTYYFFPLGTSFYAVPYVGMLNALGWDMTRSDRGAQRLLAAIVAVLVFALLFAIARTRLTYWPSVLLASAFWLGTPYSSTMGTALWSHNMAAVFALLAVLLCVHASAHRTAPRTILLAIALFSAYLCRPTLALLSPAALLYVFSFDRYAAVRIGALVAALLGVFVLFSWMEFGQVLPDYYMPKRLGGADFATAAYGNLFSPARGLFVYSPFLLFPFLLPGHLWKAVRGDLAVLLFLAWPVVHWLSVSQFPHWWGGWCYGPRLMSDVVPGFYVVTVLFFRLPLARPRWATGSFAALCGVAVLLHVWQGLYNPYSAQWNAVPPVDLAPSRLFDWDDPQFWQGRASFDRRAEHIASKAAQADLDRYRSTARVGARMDPDTKDVVYAGWWESEGTHRWSLGHEARILFRLDATVPLPTRLRMELEPLGEQRITIEVNGRQVFEGVLSPGDAPIAMDLAPNAFSADEMNEVRFRLPDATKPENGDPRTLGVALRWLELAP